MGNRCLECGVVNWQGASQCLRCNAVLTASSTGVNPFEKEEQSGSSRTMMLGIGVVVLGLALVGFKIMGSTEKAASPPPQSNVNANVLVPMTAADVQKAMPATTPFVAPTLSRDFKLTPDMIKNQQKAYRERFGRNY